MADAREVVYNELDRMLHEIFELGRAYEQEGRDDIGAVDRIINNCVSWAKADKVINVTIKTKVVKDEDKWVKCEDDLPPEEGAYLVSGKMKYEWEKEYEYFIDFADYRKDYPYEYKGAYGGYFGTYNDWYEGQQEYEIVAWMELPEPLEI